MKTLNPNLVFNQPDATYPFGKLIKTMKPNLLLLLLLICTHGGVQAQQNAVSSQVKSLELFLTTSTQPISSRVEKLVKDVHPSVYFENGSVVVRGANAVNFYTTALLLPGIPAMNMSEFDPSKIEMVTIKVTNPNQFSSGINLSALAGFSNLKYVYIISETIVTPNAIRNSIGSISPGLSVFYSILKPS